MQSPETDNHPLVSVVIPTRSRPDLVVSAVRSALTQTYPNLEIVVVIDGPDPATQDALLAIQDTRLRVETLPSSGGGGKARNAGVQRSRGEWIAFLDDDDVWLPDKLWTQMEAARQAEYQVPIVSCRLLARTPTQDHIWPDTVYDGSQSMAHYLFCRALGQNSGLIQTSSLLIKRSVLLELPFPEIKRHQDIDWIIEAVDVRQIPILMLPDILLIWHFDQPWMSISKMSDPSFSLQWISEKSQFMSKDAAFCFVNTQILPQYSRRTARDLFFLVKFLLKYNSRPANWFRFLALWVLSPTLRRQLQGLRQWARQMFGRPDVVA